MIQKKTIYLLICLISLLIALACSGGQSDEEVARGHQPRSLDVVSNELDVSNIADNSAETGNSGSAVTETAGVYAVSGKVVDNLGNGQLSVSVQKNNVELAKTESDGSFVVYGLAEGEHVLKFEKSGYSVGYSKFYVGENHDENSEVVHMITSSSTGPNGEKLTKGSLAITLKPSQSISLDNSTSLTLNKPNFGNSLRFKAKGGHYYSVIRNKNGPVKRSKYAGASLDFSKVDPTKDLDAMPGRLAAVDSTFRRSKSGGNTTAEVGLESAMMMDLTLRDSTGKAIQMTDNDYLETFVKLPENKQANYLADYNNGKRMIPWYSYDTAKDTWLREGEAELVNIGGVMYGKAKVTHFSWWNLDYPGERGALIGKVYTDVAKTKVASGVKVTLQAIGASFQTSVVTKQDGSFRFRVLRNSKIKLYAEAHGSKGEVVYYDIDNSPETKPHQQDLFLIMKEVQGIVKRTDGSPLQKALVKLPSGTGIYTDAQGKYTFETGVSSSLKLTAQFTENATSYVTQETLTSTELSQTIPSKDIVIDTNNYVVVTGEVTKNGQPLAGAVIYTLAGNRAESDQNGVYKIQISKTATGGTETADAVIIPLKAFYYDPINKQYPQIDFNLNVLKSATNYVQNIQFSDAQTVTLLGKVLVDGAEKSGLEVFSSFGTVAITDAKGEYSFKGFDGQHVSFHTSIKDQSGNDIVKSVTHDIFVTQDLKNTLSNIEFTIPKSTLFGTVYANVSGGGNIPLAGATVRTANGKVITTGTDGTYHFKLAPEVAETIWYEYDYKNSKTSIEKAVTALAVNESREMNIFFDSSAVKNVAPVFDSVLVSSYKVSQGGNITIDVLAHDKDSKSANDQISISASLVDATTGSLTQISSQVSNQGVLEAKYMFTASGNSGWSEIVFSLSDKDNTVTRNLNVEMVPEIINVAPIVLGLDVPGSVSHNSTVTATCIAHDNNGDALSYAFNISPAIGVSITTAYGEVVNPNGTTTLKALPNKRTITFQNATIGETYTLSASVSDGKETSIIRSTIGIKNHVPVFKKFTPVSFDNFIYGTSRHFHVWAEDPEGTAVSYKWELSKDGSSFEEVSATDNYKLITQDHLPRIKEIQYLTLKITATDGALSAIKLVRLSILPPGVSIVKTPLDIRVSPLQMNELIPAASDPVLYTVTLNYNNGETEDVTATVTASGYAADSLKIENKTITALKEGLHEVTFTYQSNGVTLTTTLPVSVLSPKLSMIDAIIDKVQLVVGQSTDYLLSAFFEDNSSKNVTQDTNAATLSSQPGIANFSSNIGKIESFNIGETSLTFSYTDPVHGIVRTTSIDLEVLPIELQGLEVTPELLQMIVGSTEVIQATAFYNNDTSAPVETFRTISVNPKVAVANEDHIVFPNGEGSTELIHTYEENGIIKQTTSVVEVTLPEPEIIRLEVFPENAELIVGSTQSYELTAFYNTGLREKVVPESIVYDTASGLMIDDIMYTSQEGILNVEFLYKNFTANSEMQIVQRSTEASMELLTQYGGAVYNSEIIERKIGQNVADVLVYNRGKLLTTVDVTNPEEKVELSNVVMPGYVRGFQVTDNFLHVAMGNDGYAMVTFDNPTKLLMPEGYQFPVEGYARKVITRKVGDSRYAYVLTSPGYMGWSRVGIYGVVVLDITNPLNIAKVGKINLESYARDFAIDGENLFTTSLPSWGFNFATRRWSRSGLSGLKVINLSQPQSPSLINTVSTSDSLYAINVNQGTLYAASYNKLYSFDIVDIQNIKHTGSYSDSGYKYNISFDDDKVFVAKSWRGFSQFTVDPDLGLVKNFSVQPTPSEFEFQSSDNTIQKQSGGRTSSVYDIEAHKGHLYISNGYNGLSIYKQNETGIGDQLIGYPNLGYMSDIVRSEDTLFVSRNREGLASFDISEPGRPVIGFAYDDPDYAIHKIVYEPNSDTVIASGYLKSNYWWWSYNRSNTSKDRNVLIVLNHTEKGWEKVNQIAVEGWVQDIKIKDNQVFVVSNGYGYTGYRNYYGSLVTKYLYSENKLTQDNVLEVNAWSNTLEVTSDRVIICNENGIDFIDFNLNKKAFLSRNALNEPWWFYPYGVKTFNNEKALSVMTWNGVKLIDISKIDSPKYLSTLSMGYIRDVEFEGSIAIFSGMDRADWKGKVFIYNMENIHDPVLIHEYDGASYPNKIVLNDGIAYLADGWGGLQVVRYSLPIKSFNNEPIIDLISNLRVVSGNLVTLDASGSSDEDGHPLVFEWSQIGGANVQLQIDGEKVSFTAPTQNEEVRIELKVSDGLAITSSNTLVKVNNVPHAVINTTAQTRLVSGEMYVFDASLSTDKDQDPLSFNWFLSDNTIALENNTSANTSFVSPSVGDEFALTLVVDDSYESSSNSLSFKVNTVPVLLITGNGLYQEGETVSIVSHASDVDGDVLSYSWEQESGNILVLPTNTSNVFTFTAPQSNETYGFKSRVSDGFQSSEQSFTFSIQSQNNAPSVFAGNSQYVIGGTTVHLLGSASDQDGDALTYLWQQVSGENVVLSSNTTLSTNFIAPNVSGNLFFELIADDGKVATASEAVEIYVNGPPVAHAGNNIQVYMNDVVTLSAANTINIDGDPLSYTWRQISGNAQLSLSDNTSAMPSFTVPYPNGETVVMELAVSDNIGQVSTDTVDITLVNQAPLLDFIENFPSFYMEYGNNLSQGNSPSQGNTPIQSDVIFQDIGVVDFLTLPVFTVGLADVEGDNIIISTNPSAPGLIDGDAFFEPGYYQFFLKRTTYSGSFNYEITIGDNVSDQIRTLTLQMNIPVNEPPVATVSNITIAQGWTGLLNGSSSSDPEGESLSYFWEELSGEALTFSSNTTVNPQITSIGNTGSANVRLTVTDSFGHTGSNTLLVTIGPNQAPSVHITGLNQVTENGNVTLTGSNTYDPDSQNLSYLWTVLSGNVSLSSNNLASTNVQFAQSSGNAELQLAVSDTYSTSTNTHLITVVPNLSPTVNAGNDLTVSNGANITLQPVVNDPDNGPNQLVYQWSVISGNVASLSNAGQLNATVLMPNYSTNLILRLEVSDGLATVSDNITITSVQMNTLPRVLSMSNIVTTMSKSVVVSGNFYDADQDPLSVDWYVISGNGITFSSNTSDNVQFTTQLFSENILIGANVSDGTATVSSNSWVFVQPNIVPTVSAGSNQIVTTGNVITLSGSGSDSDSGPYSLSYTWVQLSGSPIALSSNAVLNPTFTANVSGNYMFELRAYDGKDTTSSNVTIEVLSSIPSPANLNGINSNGYLNLKWDSHSMTNDYRLSYEVRGQSYQVLSSGTNTMFLSAQGNVGYMYNLTVSANVNGNWSVESNQISIKPEVIPLVDSGLNHTIYVSPSGNIYMAGNNQYGQFGSGNFMNSNVFTPTLENKIIESVGVGHNFSAYTSELFVYTIGYNNFGQLASGNNSDGNFARRVQGDFRSLGISLGQNHMIALDDVDSVYSVGLNSFGQLGLGTNLSSNTLISLSEFNDSNVSAGYNHSVKIKIDGSLWATGHNGFGQLGDGTTSDNNSFIQVISSNVIYAAAGQTHTVIVKNDGSAWASGIYEGGNPGYGSSANSTFRQIMSTNVTKVAAGASHTLLLTNDKKVWALGYNNAGQLGLGHTNDISVPVQVPLSGNVIGIGAGHQSSFFIMEDNSLWATGQNSDGQLGSGNFINVTPPIKVFSE